MYKADTEEVAGVLVDEWPGERTVPSAAGGESSVLDALANCAERADMTLSGLLIRIVLQSAMLAPQVLSGKTPRMIKFRFLPLAALHRVLRRNMNQEYAQELVAKVLFVAALTDTASNFKTAVRDPRMATLASEIERVYRGPGKHQKIEYEKRTPTHFQFVITDCMFVRVLRELGIEGISTQLCEADRHFWNKVVTGTGIRFSKTEKTIAHGGCFCRASFVTGEAQSRLAEAGQQKP